MVTVIRYTTIFAKDGDYVILILKSFAKTLFRFDPELNPSFLILHLFEHLLSKKLPCANINPNGFVWKGLLSPPCGGRKTGGQCVPIGHRLHHGPHGHGTSLSGRHGLRHGPEDFVGEPEAAWIRLGKLGNNMASWEIPHIKNKNELKFNEHILL